MSDLIAIRRAALNYLARREHSYYELTCKLQQKKQFSNADIDAVLTALSQEGLLNNLRFIENYIHFRREKGFGPLRIQAELRAKGLAEEVIEDHLKIADNAWFSLAVKLWQKRFKGIIPQDTKTRAQQMRFLYQRGFTLEQIEAVFNSVMPV